MLDTQIHLYSVDTGHFFSNHEKRLYDSYCRLRRERRALAHQLSGPEDSAKRLCLLKHKQEKARKAKERLLALMSNKTMENHRTKGHHHIRRLRQDGLHDTHIISIFESALTRTMGIPKDTLTDAIFIVQAFYLDLFEDLLYHGFTYRGEAYRYFTSSAGQIRQKKAVFIKEAMLHAMEKTLMCGLTLDKINEKGGNNVNKHLAYLALSGSATDRWEGFDIDRCIVVEDFKTKVPGTFDYIDEQDYSITRKTGAVPITHTDGAGMMLPYVATKNTMFRAPWIKGLLGVFDFREFIRRNHCSPLITDIYGKEHDIIKEDIQIIFTKSQFKMHKFYDSWEEYKDCFRQYHCEAGLCNTEEDRIKNARINYQMLQTLTDITEEEMECLARPSVTRITNLCQSEDTMKEALGITPYNTKLSPFQQAVKRYPALLNDTYVKDILREVKNSLLKSYRSGKLEINGKYTFLLPDFYAACQYWFGHNPSPEGLLADGEVFCRLFPKYDTLDCLRSPHLYKEHAIRHNMAHHSFGKRAEALREWFPTDALYTGCHDLMSKLLQFDVDGDKALVVADKDFISITRRNMEGIVPLYYNMQKAQPTQLNPGTVFAGLRSAFTGGNIGIYSNHISKIWNHSVFQTGTEQEKQQAMDCVKRLCCQNNFVIDFAKTLYKPEFPKNIARDIRKFTDCKLPAFFAYAKDKEPSQVEPANESFVNSLVRRIPDMPINTRGLQLGEIDYRLLMGRPDTRCSREVAQLYDKRNREYRYKINRKEEFADNLHYVASSIRQEFSALGYPEETISDMLVHYLYGSNRRSKQLLWFCYGQHIVNHLKENVAVKNTKAIRCQDCGQWLEVDSKDNTTNRCVPCYLTYRKKYKAERERLRREKKRMEAVTGICKC